MSPKGGFALISQVLLSFGYQFVPEIYLKGEQTQYASNDVCLSDWPYPACMMLHELPTHLHTHTNIHTQINER